MKERRSHWQLSKTPSNHAEAGGPATSRVGAIAGLEAGLDMAKGDPLTSSLAARGASWAEGLDPAGFTAEHRASSTARLPSRAPPSTWPTTSWPGTKGKLTMCSK